MHPLNVGNNGIEPFAPSLSGKYSTGELIAMVYPVGYDPTTFPYEGTALPIELRIQVSPTGLEPAITTVKVWRLSPVFGYSDILSSRWKSNPRFLLGRKE